MYEDLSVEDYKTRFKDGEKAHLLLDVRTVEEFEEARMPDALNIPLDELEARTDEITQAAGEDPIVLVCRSGVRSIMGAQMLRYAGLKDLTLYNLDSGVIGWARSGYPLERGAAE